MINDGSAERMVRNRKVTWWQIAAIVVIALFLLLFAGLAFLFFNGDILVNLINKATVGEGAELLSSVKQAYPCTAVYAYEQKDGYLNIEFRYYEEIADEPISMVEYGYNVKKYIEEYLRENPDCFINSGAYRVDLRFPDVHYSNYNICEETEFVYSDTFGYVTYERSDMDFADFAKFISTVTEGAEFAIIKGEGELPTSADVIENMKNLESVTVILDGEDDNCDTFAEALRGVGVEVRTVVRK
ncbi:MAG: hypothetical protein K6F92_06500 [Lachnospiraceae bacterium]|nr:hypothetical protein [Lachnospiraceae bacterium]